MRLIHLLLAVTTGLATMGLHAQSNPSHEAIVPGFRGILWGTHLDSVIIEGQKARFVKVEDAAFPRAYYLPGDDMTIGAVRLNKLYYIFNKDSRFTKVYMEANKKFLEDMLFILKYKFGPPSDTRDLGHVRIYEWRIDGVNFTISEFKDRPTFLLTIESNWEYVERIRKNVNVPDF